MFKEIISSLVLSSTFSAPISYPDPKTYGIELGQTSFKKFWDQNSDLAIISRQSKTFEDSKQILFSLFPCDKFLLGKEKAKAVTVTSLYPKEQNTFLEDIINTGCIINFSCVYTRKLFSPTYKTLRLSNIYIEDFHCTHGEGRIACFKNIKNHDITISIREIMGTRNMVLSWDFFWED